MSKVSVIIPTRNRPASLQSALQSVLIQPLVVLEIVVIDDASKQQYIAEIIQVASQDDRIRLVRNEKNIGVSACRNQGIAMAKNDYLLFLDDDDELLPGMLVQSLEAIRGRDVVSCRSEVIAAHLSTSKTLRYNRQQTAALDLYPMGVQPAEHIFLYTPQIHTFLVRRSAIGDVRFSEELRYGEDMIFWLQLAANGLRFEKLEFVGSRYHLHLSSASQQETNQSKMAFYQQLPNYVQPSAEVNNLLWIKMAYLSLRQGYIRCAVYLLKALSRPKLFFRHLRYYF
ncbi:glycosyltransferase [Reichenbachiella carrageenanivorans]|uniref:Glycosyltransferase n=1 Tax=Reichenbachiella carrageenanivorans TaxID=2979869 RepID=A0ABY6D0A4_9BACT|nr:glycosyltransferase [Reichenbachiella carrageenanivorans]UXX79596.1 glycosyltransferase [Reichenbachiella carrageenanivorans]